MAKQETLIKAGPCAKFPKLNWEDLTEADAYIEAGTGELCRVLKDALITGGAARPVEIIT